MNPGHTPVLRSAGSNRYTGKVSRETDRLVARMSLGQESEASLMRDLLTDRQGKANTQHRRSLDSAGTTAAALKDFEGRLEIVTARLREKETEV